MNILVAVWVSLGVVSWVRCGWSVVPSYHGDRPILADSIVALIVCLVTGPTFLVIGKRRGEK